MKPKVEQLCSLMDAEYEINYKKLRKQREEQKKQQANQARVAAQKKQVLSSYGITPPKMSRAQMLA